ncbi:MAG: hypothetical protein QW400_02050 [Candidatus Diapherotrites archaeon]
MSEKFALVNEKKFLAVFLAAIFLFVLIFLFFFFDKNVIPSVIVSTEKPLQKGKTLAESDITKTPYSQYVDKAGLVDSVRLHYGIPQNITKQLTLAHSFPRA